MFLRFSSEAGPVDIVAPDLEHLVELCFDMPMFELRAVEQHDTRGMHLSCTPAAAQYCPVLHVPRQELPDVSHGKDVGIYDHCPTPITHQFRRHESQRRE